MKALIVVDLQREFIVDDYTREMYDKVLQYVKTATGYDRIIATQFIRSNPLYMSELDYYFPQNPAPLEFEYDKLIQKTGYGLPDMEYLNLSREYHYDVVGCETDACVFKIALDLFDREHSFNILYPYVFTGSGASDEDLRRMLEHVLGRTIKYDLE